jgi:hypothetical protein
MDGFAVAEADEAEDGAGKGRVLVGEGGRLVRDRVLNPPIGVVVEVEAFGDVCTELVDRLYGSESNDESVEAPVEAFGEVGPSREDVRRSLSASASAFDSASLRCLSRSRSSSGKSPSR